MCFEQTSEEVPSVRPHYSVLFKQQITKKSVFDITKNDRRVRTAPALGVNVYRSSKSVGEECVYFLYESAYWICPQASVAIESLGQ